MDHEGHRVPRIRRRRGCQMSVLCAKDIRELLNGKPDDVGTLVIAPFDRDALDQDSIDLRLGSRFLVPHLHKIGSFEFGGSQTRRDRSTKHRRHGQPDPIGYQRLVHVPAHDHIVVPAHSTILGAVFEYIKLPFNVSGQVLTKSSLARLFITIEGAPWIHPLYRGCLTLEIANASGTAIKLKPYTRIAQLVLFKVEGVTRPPDSMEGKYIGPVDPELPDFAD
jgi:dCTP deaminase